MGLFKKWFGKKKQGKQLVATAEDFWNWFTLHQQRFYNSIDQYDRPENTVNSICDHLEQVNKNIYALMGMLDNTTAELILTADGEIKSVVFIEDIIAAAPALPNWKFTALKPANGFDNGDIEMNGYSFTKEKLRFFTSESTLYPDDIEINIVHEDYNAENRNDIAHGTLLFLDNSVGELNMITQVDTIDFAFAPEGTDLIPIEKLNHYLRWREKEFVEKYEDVRYDTFNDEYSIYEAEDDEHNLVLAVINRPLLQWENKASHPWVLQVTITYSGDSNGMPDKQTYLDMNDLEDALLKALPNKDGYLYLGRETYRNERDVYIACREFRNSSRMAAEIIAASGGRLEADYSIFKDKYWRVLSRFA